MITSRPLPIVAGQQWRNDRTGFVYEVTLVARDARSHADIVVYHRVGPDDTTSRTHWATTPQDWRANFSFVIAPAGAA